MEGGSLEEVVAIASRLACRGLAAYDGEVACRLGLAGDGRAGAEGAGREIPKRSRDVGRRGGLTVRGRPVRLRAYVSGKGGG